MITLKPDAKISILMPHQNKALNLALQQATPQQLESLKEGKDLKSLLSSLFQAKLTHIKSDQVLLDILKSNNTFKQFGNFSKELKNVITTLKAEPNLAPKLSKLEHSLQSITTLTAPVLKEKVANSGIFMESKIASAALTVQTIGETLQKLQHALVQTNHSEAKNLSQSLAEFLEHPVLTKASEDMSSARILIKTIQTLTDTVERILPKIDPQTPHQAKAVEEVHVSIKQLASFTKPEHLLIQTQLEEHLGHDIKSQLMQLSDDIKALSTPIFNDLQTQIDKLVTHIDYHQLLSHLDGSNTLYFPFSWDMLEEGSLAFKKREEKKFYCEVHLQLKEYGKIDLMMALYEGNQLEIQAHTQNPEFKKLIQEHLGTLRTLLTQAGINPRTIRVYDATESQAPSKSAYAPEDTDFQSGFEVKV
ncbi:MAG: flagellar hook-length control protein FliK [Sulfuricurvum sp.]|nr:flagellar hook-length control protein FliK [Sulfuricurvum sp.]